MLENTAKIFKKLAECVGIEEIDFADQKWFERQQWTLIEEHEFKEWLITHITEHPEVIPELWEQGLKPNQNIHDLAVEFTISFGWDIKPTNKKNINPKNK